MKSDRLPKKHLILVGLPGSGKTTIATELSRKLDMPVIEIGSFVISGAKQDISSKNPLEFADRTFRRGDYLNFVSKAFEKIKETNKYCIILGPRHKKELEFLKMNLSGAVSVGLIVEDQIREKRRSLQINQEGDADILNIIRHRDLVEKSWGAVQTIQMCDFILENQGDVGGIIDIIEKILIEEGV